MIAMNNMVQLTELDIDPEYKIDSIPQDFECQLCFMIKDNFYECSHCSQSACRDCLEDFTKRSGNGDISQRKYECTICHKVNVMHPQNRIMFEVFQNLRFACPGACKEIFPYKELKTHKQRGLCYPGYRRPPTPTGKGGGSQMMPSFSNNNIPSQQMDQPMVAAYQDKRPPLGRVHFLQKDSKKIFQIEFQNKFSQVVRVDQQNQFPHNFQCVNGPLGQLYLVGGGDYQKDDESLYNLYEIIPSQNYKFLKRDQMKHPRHGHSACWFGEKFIVVTGSRKEKNQSQFKCEMYNSDIDLWFEIADLNVGRHYHSSCAFSDRYVYAFCGIANQTRKYINSIEKFDNQNRSKWTLINIPQKDFPDRQGCGVVQRDNKDILVFGGFSGKFLKDSYLLDTTSCKMNRTQQTPNEIFLFQMPTVFDSKTNAAYTCDLQRQLLYKFDDRNQWSVICSLRS